MNDALIEEVTEAVLRRLAVSGPTALLIGREPQTDTGYHYTDRPPYDAIVIGSLSAAELLHFSNTAVWNALLNGTPVYLNEDGLEYRAYRATANRLLWMRLQEQEKQLQQYGVQLLSASRTRRVITAAEARQMRSQHKSPPAGSVITPLARDILEGSAE